jgi:hypothetical protein
MRITYLISPFEVRWILAFSRARLKVSRVLAELFEQIQHRSGHFQVVSGSEMAVREIVARIGRASVWMMSQIGRLNLSRIFSQDEVTRLPA